MVGVVSIPVGVISLGKGAFGSGLLFTEVEAYSSAISTVDNIFNETKSVTKATFGPEVKKVPFQAFASAAALDTVYLYSDVLVEFGTDAFTRVYIPQKLYPGNMYVPANLVTSYKATYPEMAESFKPLA